MEQPRQSLDLAYHDDCVWVVALTTSLQAALARADPASLPPVAAAWARYPEVSADDAEDVANLADGLDDLAALARRATDRGQLLYCWVCL